jgi:hypothetical protein
MKRFTKDATNLVCVFKLFAMPHSSLTHVAVFGERCSGTNHAVSWIQQNVGLKPLENYGWKHAAIRMESFPKDAHTLVVLVVRNLPDWLRSLHLKPHHLSPEMRGLPFADFIKRRVTCIWDHTLGVSPRHPAFGTEVLTERHHEKPFANLLRMRKHKHRLWLKQLAQLPHTLILQHETLLDEPDLVLEKFRALGFTIQAPEALPVTSYKGKGTDYQKNQYAKIEPAAMRSILEQVDWETEQRLGYDTQADLQAAAEEVPFDWESLRTALAGHPTLFNSVTKQFHQQSLALAQAQKLVQNQRKYLLSLLAAIKRARPRWSWFPARLPRL